MRFISIKCGEYTAVVSKRGATLISLSYGDWNLLSGPATEQPHLGHHGAVLAPWPNRLDRGAYIFRGSSYQLACNDTAYGHAIHGFAFSRDWAVKVSTSQRVTLETPLFNSEGYPFHVNLSITYEVTPQGLTCLASWVNVGETVAPFGLGFHPYFRPGPSPLDEWMLEIEATHLRRSDPRSLDERTVLHSSSADYNFLKLKPVGDLKFSNTYFSRDSNAPIRATLSDPDPDGFTITLQAGYPFNYLQVFTGDLPNLELNRKGLSLEPQTCPTNSFATGDSLIAIAPGQRGTGSWSVSAHPH